MVSTPTLGGLPTFGRAVRIVNKYVSNPLMLQLAGRRYWYVGRLEHVGRRSGRRYLTPVAASPVAGGFVVPLPYGTDVDWLRNLEAAGHGVLVQGGRRFTVSAPEVHTTADYLEQLPHRNQLQSRLWRIEHWLRVAAEPQG